MYRNEEARKELLAAAEGLTDEQLNAEVEKGRWTVGQVLDHLCLMERGVTAQMKAVLADPNNGPARKKKPIEFTLDRTVKVEAPVPFRPTANVITSKEIVDKLHRSREQLMNVINSIEDHTILEEKSAKHPVFGTMDLAQWIEFVGLHERRHLQQIQELTAKM